MKIINNNLQVIAESYGKISKVKGLLVWKQIMFNNIRSKRAYTAVLEEFDIERKQLLEQMCEKNENGTPHIEDDKYVFAEGVQEQANIIVTELAKSIGEKESEVDLYVLKLSDFEKISKDIELAEVLEPLYNNGLVNEEVL